MGKENLSRDGLRTYTAYTEQVYWLLLHERQPQTQKLKPAHTNTHSVCGSGLSTARLVSQLTKCKQCWLGLDPVWGLMRETLFPVHSGGCQNSYACDSRSKSQIHTGQGWRLPLAPKPPQSHRLPASWPSPQAIHNMAVGFFKASRRTSLNKVG